METATAIETEATETLAEAEKETIIEFNAEIRSHQHFHETEVPKLTSFLKSWAEKLRMNIVFAVPHGEAPSRVRLSLDSTKDTLYIYVYSAPYVLTTNSDEHFTVFGHRLSSAQSYEVVTNKNSHNLNTVQIYDNTRNVGCITHDDDIYRLYIYNDIIHEINAIDAGKIIQEFLEVFEFAITNQKEYETKIKEKMFITTLSEVLEEEKNKVTKEYDDTIIGIEKTLTDLKKYGNKKFQLELQRKSWEEKEKTCKTFFANLYRDILMICPDIEFESDSLIANFDNIKIKAYNIYNSDEYSIYDGGNISVKIPFDLFGEITMSGGHDGLVPHPHCGLSYSKWHSVCWGGVEGDINLLHSSMEWGLLLQQIKIFLESVNTTDSRGVQVSAWPLLEGDGIGDEEDEGCEDDCHCSEQCAAYRAHDTECGCETCDVFRHDCWCRACRRILHDTECDCDTCADYRYSTCSCESCIDARTDREVEEDDEDED